jgi:hypothetical protein
MRNTGVLFFLLAFLCGNALAQKSLAEEMAESETWQGLYHVTDMVNPKNSRLEMWKQRVTPASAKGGETYEVIKEPFGGKVPSMTEISTEWLTESRTGKNESYLREFFTVHPATLHPGRRSFGYIERRATSGNLLIENSPMFYYAEEVLGGYRVTFDIFLAGNETLRIIREYQENEYFIPMRESHVMSVDGAVTQHFIYARKE